MEPVPEAKRREVNTFLSFVADAETDRAIDARTFHVTAAYTEGDFRALSDRLIDRGIRASFSFLARDLDELAGAMRALHDAGHELVLHGYRHTSFGSVPYDIAHDELSTAIEAFEDTINTRPTGLHVAFMDASEGTLRAAADVGIEWVLGRCAGRVPNGVTLVSPVSPWDTRLLEAGTEPAAVFEQLGQGRDDDEGVFLCHPNLHEYYDAQRAFDTWLDSTKLAPVATAHSDTGTGLVLDCVRPLRVA